MTPRFRIYVDGKWLGGSFTEQEAKLAMPSEQAKYPGKHITAHPIGDDASSPSDSSPSDSSPSDSSPSDSSPSASSAVPTGTEQRRGDQRPLDEAERGETEDEAEDLVGACEQRVGRVDAPPARRGKKEPA